MSEEPVACAECGEPVDFDDLKIDVPPSGDARPLCLRHQVDVPRRRLFAPASWGGDAA